MLCWYNVNDSISRVSQHCLGLTSSERLSADANALLEPLQCLLTSKGLPEILSKCVKSGRPLEHHYRTTDGNMLIALLGGFRGGGKLESEAVGNTCDQN